MTMQFAQSFPLAYTLLTSSEAAIGGTAEFGGGEGTLERIEELIVIRK